MRRWAAAAALMVVACSQGTTQPVADHTPTAAATPSLSPNPSPSQVGLTDLPLSFPAFACRLPISTPDGQGAFIAVSPGTVTFDPQGKGAHYFDRAFSRWLPVSREAVSPDGAHYAYAEIGSQGGDFLHVVDVGTGKDHVRELTDAMGFSSQVAVLNYSTEGIYLVQGFEQPGAGLWLLNPNTGLVRRFSSTIQPIALTPGAAWAQVLNPADLNPIVTGSSTGTLPNEIDRFDLATGKQTTWLYRPGTGLGIIGFDLGGHPVISSLTNFRETDDPKAEVMVTLNPDSRRSIYKGSLAKTLGGGIADQHGIWFGSPQGIYLYSERDGLEKLSNQPGSPANGCF
jgi:hypothetical protein